MPPKTSATEVLLLFGLAIVFGFIHWLVRFYIRTEIGDKTLESLSKNTPQSISIEKMQEAVRLFHRGFTNLMITLMPLVGFWLSQTCVSLARDAGHTIFPWFILASALILSLLLTLSESLRMRMIRSRIAIVEPQHTK